MRKDYKYRLLLVCMWVCKFRFDGSNILYGRTSKLFNLIIRGYNLSSFQKGKDFFVNSTGLILGEEKDRMEVIKFLKKDKHIIKIEEKNGFIILLIKEDRSFKPFYSPAFIYVSPILIDKGIYHFHIASWFRKDIEELLKRAEKFPEFKLINLKEEKIENISIADVQPNLTDKQKKAYELALRNGYYDYPRRIDLNGLARLMHISYSTFQQHLRYAERKLNRCR